MIATGLQAAFLALRFTSLGRADLPGLRRPVRNKRAKHEGSHKGLGISDRDFDALVQDLGKSLHTFEVPARAQKELVVLVAPMRKDIIER